MNILVIIVAALVFGFKMFKASSTGELILAKIAVNAPIFSDLVIKSNASNFSRSLSTLMAAGIPMLDAIEQVAKMMSNRLFRDGLMETKTQVAKGIPLSKPLKDMELFPTMLVQMVKIGEETGNIEDMMEKVADLYDREVDLATESLTQAMEPLTMVLLAGIVGLIVAAVYGPILSMYEGIDNLLEMILLTSEVLELKANPKRRARGLVIESKLDKGKGVCATVLVQKGTLKVGQPIAAGEAYGKVRAMTDENGNRVKEAGPSIPVEIQGLSAVPNAGEIFISPESDKEARSFAETFISEGRKSLLEETRSRMSLDDLFAQIQAGNIKELELIVKADVQGSVEALKQSLEKLSNEEVVVKIIHSGVGAITESDVVLASASNAIIIGFNVRPDASAKAVADAEGVDIKLYKVIYNAIEDVEAAMKGMLDPIYEERVIGHAEIRQIFKASGVGNIAGSLVVDGVVEKECGVRLMRGDDLIHEGKLASLKRFKDDVKEAKAGYECGIVIEDFDGIQEGDIVECFKMVEIPR